MSAGPGFALQPTANPFGAPTGASPLSALNLQSGDPTYQNAIVTQATKNLKPAYQSALTATQQDMTNRGLGGSGMDQFAKLQDQNDFLGQVGNIATKAATQGADVTLQNQRIQNEYNQQQLLQQRQLTMEQELQQNQQNFSQNQQTNGALMNMGEKLGAGALGGAFGGPVGASLATAGVEALQGGGGPGAAPTVNYGGQSLGLGQNTDMGWPAQSGGQGLGNFNPANNVPPWMIMQQMMNPTAPGYSGQ